MYDSPPPQLPEEIERLANTIRGILATGLGAALEAVPIDKLPGVIGMDGSTSHVTAQYDYLTGELIFHGSLSLRVERDTAASPNGKLTSGH